MYQVFYPCNAWQLAILQIPYNHIVPPFFLYIYGIHSYLGWYLSERLLQGKQSGILNPLIICSGVIRSKRFEEICSVNLINYHNVLIFLFLGLTKTNSQLVRHINFQNNQCPICYKIFKRTPHVHRHYVEMHMGHADFECKKCGKLFKRRYLMEQHRKKCNLSGGNLGGHRCLTCKIVYTTKDKLIKHMTEKHNLYLLPQNVQSVEQSYE